MNQALHQSLNGFAKTGIVAALAVLWSCPVWSQTSAPAKPTNTLEEIIVTAERTATNLQNTPVAVTSLSANDLSQKGATSLLDLGAYTPSLTVASRSTFGTTSAGFTIRGIGSDAQGSSPSVGIYIDDVYYPSGIGNLLGFFDIDRIEVLRGPQGTLFGRNTIAGAVQYVSAKPSDEFSGYVTATAGTDKRYELGAVVNVPINDVLALRVSARNNNVGGYVTDDLNGIKRGAEKTGQGRIQLRLTPNKDFTLDVKGESVHLETNGRAIAVTGVNPQAQFVIVGSTFNPVINPTPETRPLTNAYISSNQYHFAGFNSPDFLDFKFSTGQVVAAYNLNDHLTLKSISAYSHTDSRLASDTDNTPLGFVIADRGTITTQLFTQEFQLAGRSLGDQLKWTTGAYYYDGIESSKDQYIHFGNNGPAVSQNNGNTQLQTRAKAVYGQATYNFTQQLSATVGLRYSKEDVKGLYLNSITQLPGFLVGQPTVPLVSFVGPATVAPQKNTFSNTSPHFSLNYQLDPDLLIYGKASKGFRAGGFSVSGNLPGNFLAFSPETAWTYEAGLRIKAMNGRLRFNPTVFWTDWKNIQFNTFFFTNSTIVPITANAGDARIKGVELETQFALTDQWLLTGSASALDGVYTRLPAVAPPLPPIVTASDSLQHTPKFKYALGTRYTLPLASGARVVTSLDYAWTAKQRSAVSIADAITIPSYGLLNARVQFDSPDGRYSVALYGTNLTDKYYWIGGVNGVGTFGTVEADVGRPREFGANLKVYF